MKRELPFTKMHGLGNDFVVMDARELRVDDWPALARAMCDRHFGVGADQLLLVCESARADVTMRLFNTDGFEAEMCGNGIRCVGKFMYERSIVRQKSLSVETLGGIKHLQLHLEGECVTGATVAMDVPQVIFADETIDVTADGQPQTHLNLMGVDMGNPHAVAFLETPVAYFPLEQIGPLVEHHLLFPNRTNFEIVHVISPTVLQLRVWERSAGITLACGTGACAAMVAARRKGLIGDEVEVHMPGGVLHVAWDGTGEVWLTGPAATVFEGTWETGR